MTGVRHHPDVIARVSELWLSHLSGSEIGRQLGMTKNAVIGIASRAHLPRRPAIADKGHYQPIGDDERERIIEMRARHVSIAEISRTLHRSERTIARVCAGESGRAAAQAPRPRRQEPKPILPMLLGARCLYLLGERDPNRWICDERVSYLQCDAPAVRGSYCSKHAAQCYYRSPVRQAPVQADAQEAAA